MLTVPQIAQVAHQVNMAYCASQGDNSQKTWEEAPEWQRTSAINQVRFHLDNPDAALSHTHDSWMKEKVESGWVYGSVEDIDKMISPYIVLWDQLSPYKKTAFSILQAIVLALGEITAEEVL